MKVSKDFQFLPKSSSILLNLFISGDGLRVLIDTFSRCGVSLEEEDLLANILGDNCKMFEMEHKDDFLGTGGFPESFWTFSSWSNLERRPEVFLVLFLGGKLFTFSRLDTEIPLKAVKSSMVKLEPSPDKVWLKPSLKTVHINLLIITKRNIIYLTPLNLLPFQEA